MVGVDLTKANQARVAQFFCLLKRCFEGVYVIVAIEKIGAKKFDDQLASGSDVARPVGCPIQAIAQMGFNFVLAGDDVAAAELCC